MLPRPNSAGHVVKPSAEMLKLAAQLLLQGECIAFPTETVYGLGAVATDPQAVAKVFALKNRPLFDPLIVHCASLSMVSSYTQWPANEVIAKLASQFWPGPLTILLPKKNIPDIVTAGLPEVAVRIPAHPVALALLEKVNLPIAAPSANPFGKLSPTTAEHVLYYFGDKIKLILDGGKTEKGLESTIIRLYSNHIEILRPGPISPGMLESVSGLEVRLVSKAETLVPGMSKSHYAPSTSLTVVSKINPEDARQTRAALFFKAPDFEPAGFCAYRILSREGSLVEAAANLFSYLHELDLSGAQEILAEAVKEEGIGLAIMNRLRKAEH
ncbi:MAG: L-threonylcarbamoyladenylate synthase [Leptospiraceae bacterium]|nr:L-threonylcarbamoyladenylate synthase [Leptospiraceae bacterium]MDW8307535.1 L-threonylcarbamoyladenylate synthase [Leptospiraceae bacterium]